MSLYSEFATDPKLEADGFLYRYIGRKGKPVFEVMLRRPGGANKLYESVQEEVTAPYRRAKNLTADTKNKIAREVFAKACVVPNSWFTYLPSDNPEAEDGVEKVAGIQERQADGTDMVVPATVANLVRVLGKQPELFSLLAVEATEIDNYRVEALEDEAKN